MQIVGYFFGRNSSESSSCLSDTPYEEVKSDSCKRCALRALQTESAKGSSGAIVQLLSKKHIVAQPPRNFIVDSYLTFEDLQFFRVHTKEMMQSEYISLLNKLNDSLGHIELTNCLKKLFLLLFYEIDPYVANDQGETLPRLIAKHQNNPKTSKVHQELLESLYAKYCLISKG